MVNSIHIRHVAGSTLLVLTCVDLQAPKDIFILWLLPDGTPYLRLYDCSNISFMKEVKEFYLDNHFD